MTHRKTHRNLARRAPDWARLGLAFFLLAAFTLQSFVIQTHIHIGTSAVTFGFVQNTNAGTPDKPSPLDNDSTNCLFCQEVMHAGHFVMPAAAALALPTEFVSIVPIRIALPLFVGAIAHGWQSRGPPRH
jgi:hypothetical protein